MATGKDEIGGKRKQNEITRAARDANGKKERMRKEAETMKRKRDEMDDDETAVFTHKFNTIFR